MFVIIWFSRDPAASTYRSWKEKKLRWRSNIESEEEGTLASMAVVQESDMVHEVYRACLSFISPRGWGWLVDGAMAAGLESAVSITLGGGQGRTSGAGRGATSGSRRRCWRGCSRRAPPSSPANGW